MTIKTDFIQVGVSNTATQNFTLKTNNDGTAKLARGNFDATTQDVLTVNSGGVVDFPQGATIAGTAGQKMLLTASQATTSGTSIDFTGIPSWAKRVTVELSGVSTSGTSPVILQLGAGATQTTGYTGSGSWIAATSVGSANFTTGIAAGNTANAAGQRSGSMRLHTMGGNLWVGDGTFGIYGTGTGETATSGGNVTLSGTLDRIRLTTVNGTDTFDAGSVSLLIEGY